MFDPVLGWSFEPAWVVGWAVLLAVTCLVAWTLNLVALPGNWVAVAALAMYVWLGPDAGRAAVGVYVLVAGFAFAVVGELVEFAAAALGAKRAGASRRSTLYALLGSIVGALAGAVIGIPIPAIGSILAAILFGGAGATVGAMYGEWSGGTPWRESWAIGHAAFWGRTLGMIGKLAAGMAIVVLVILALVF
ncbi:MAG: DUF456 domain-containing protein [Planctomycetaceae bacterium]